MSHTLLASLSALVARDVTKTYGDSEEEAQDGYDAALAFAEVHDAWNAEGRAEETGARLGLSALRRDRPVDALSGGQRSRLALAALLVRRPACLLLDEPTNHISLALAEELEEAVERSSATVVVATHDRWLRRRWT